MESELSKSFFMESTDTKPSFSVAKAKIDISGICSSACPFVGIDNDRSTPMAFPHPANRCYRHKEPVRMQSQFQRTFCLSERYADCSIFLQQDPEKLPQFEPVSLSRQINQYRIRLSVPVIISLILFSILISWPVLNQVRALGTSFSLPFDLDPVYALIQDLPQVDVEPEVQTEETRAAFHKSVNISVPTESSLAGEASSDFNSQPLTNKESGGFRTVPYTSD